MSNLADAIKTHPIILTMEQQLLKYNGSEYLVNARIPIGHVLSVLVEELRGGSPDISEHMNGLNRCIVRRYGYGVFENLSEAFVEYPTPRIIGLSIYLSLLQSEGRINKKRADYVFGIAMGFPEEYLRSKEQKNEKKD